MSEYIEIEIEGNYSQDIEVFLRRCKTEYTGPRMSAMTDLFTLFRCTAQT